MIIPEDQRRTFPEYAVIVGAVTLAVIVVGSHYFPLIWHSFSVR